MIKPPRSTPTQTLFSDAGSPGTGSTRHRPSRLRAFAFQPSILTDGTP
jgi:hypothetical protein